MSTPILMPRLSDSMEEGTILKWMKAVGDEVAVGDELVEIETDKANMVYEADQAGTLIEIADEDATLAVGEPIAQLGEPGEKPAAAPAKPKDEAAPEPKADEPEAKSEATPAEAPAPSPAQPTPAPATTTAATAVPATPGARVKASPLARRVASERGVALESVAGSGPGGRIVRADVESAPVGGPAPAAAPAAAGDPGAAKGSVEVIEPTKLQQVVARRMAESKATAPHFYLTTEVDMSAAWAARAALKKSAPEGSVIPSFNDMVVKASALALREIPIANGSWKDGRFELYSRINVGIAVAADGALVVPTIFDADRKGLAELATEARRLAGKVREGTISPPELAGGTFTVSNLGMFGITSFQAVINVPQAAILAVGSIEDRAVVRDGQLVPGKLMALTLSCDHRILYGADGAKLVGRIRALLEQPLALAL